MSKDKKKDKKKDSGKFAERIEELEIELAELKAKHATDLRLIRVEYEDKVKRLEAENDEIKTIIERPLF
jgi:hypothetical protein